MNQGYLRHIASAFVILMAMIACATPNQTVQPTSGIDPHAVGTAVAGTAQAASQQTAVVQSPVPVMTGTTLEQTTDGTTTYMDYDGGFEVTFPVGWLAVRPDSEEFNAALAKDAAVNAVLHDQMILDQAGYKANYDRLYSYILRPDIKKKSLLGFSKLVWKSEDSIPIDNDAMRKVVQDLESPGGIPGFHADTAQIHEDGAVKMIEIGGRFTTSDGQGGTVPFYTTIVFFKPSATSATRITFTFLYDYYAQVSTDVTAIAESIRIIGPQ